MNPLKKLARLRQLLDKEKGSLVSPLPNDPIMSEEIKEKTMKDLFNYILENIENIDYNEYINKDILSKDKDLLELADRLEFIKQLAVRGIKTLEESMEKITINEVVNNTKQNVDFELIKLSLDKLFRNKKLEGNITDSKIHFILKGLDSFYNTFKLNMEKIVKTLDRELDSSSDKTIRPDQFDRLDRGMRKYVSTKKEGKELEHYLYEYSSFYNWLFSIFNIEYIKNLITQFVGEISGENIEEIEEEHVTYNLEVLINSLREEADLTKMPAFKNEFHLAADLNSYLIGNYDFYFNKPDILNLVKTLRLKQGAGDVVYATHYGEVISSRGSKGKYVPNENIFSLLNGEDPFVGNVIADVIIGQFPEKDPRRYISIKSPSQYAAYENRTNFIGMRWGAEKDGRIYDEEDFYNSIKLLELAEEHTGSGYKNAKTQGWFRKVLKGKVDDSELETLVRSIKKFYDNKVLRSFGLDPLKFLDTFYQFSKTAPGQFDMKRKEYKREKTDLVDNLKTWNSAVEKIKKNENISDEVKEERLKNVKGMVEKVINVRVNKIIDKLNKLEKQNKDFYRQVRETISNYRMNKHFPMEGMKREFLSKFIDENKNNPEKKKLVSKAFDLIKDFKNDLSRTSKFNEELNKLFCESEKGQKLKVKPNYLNKEEKLELKEIMNKRGLGEVSLKYQFNDGTSKELFNEDFLTKLHALDERSSMFVLKPSDLDKTDIDLVHGLIREYNKGLIQDEGLKNKIKELIRRLNLDHINRDKDGKPIISSVIKDQPSQEDLDLNLLGGFIKDVIGYGYTMAYIQPNKNVKFKILDKEYFESNDFKKSYMNPSMPNGVIYDSDIGRVVAEYHTEKLNIKITWDGRGTFFPERVSAFYSYQDPKKYFGD